ncbi:hypothetical protein [Geminicoccus roseus]|uniref:hypothetical protein n=1 Tax=Geminicoccus roseus TaxID=404900 RepID=UPI0012F9AB41|nr:hypothetical protein [Geminicoccus roseus]
MIIIVLIWTGRRDISRMHGIAARSHPAAAADLVRVRDNPENPLRTPPRDHLALVGDCAQDSGGQTAWDAGWPR